MDTNEGERLTLIQENDLSLTDHEESLQQRAQTKGLTPSSRPVAVIAIAS